jgi:hypothetical protein
MSTLPYRTINRVIPKRGIFLLVSAFLPQKRMLSDAAASESILYLQDNHSTIQQGLSRSFSGDFEGKIRAQAHKR